MIDNLTEKLYMQTATVWFCISILISAIILLFQIKRIFKCSITDNKIMEYSKAQHNEELILRKQNEEDRNILASEQFSKTCIMLNHVQCLKELHIASERCYIKRNAVRCIELITYCPYLINVKYGSDGKTPFHRVCTHKHVCLMSFMLSKGADPWIKTNAEETALCLAIRACIKNSHPSASLDCLELLQRYNCYLEYTNKWYAVYLEAAMFTNNKKLVNWLFRQSSKYTVQEPVRWSSLPYFA